MKFGDPRLWERELELRAEEKKCHDRWLHYRWFYISLFVVMSLVWVVVSMVALRWSADAFGFSGAVLTAIVLYSLFHAFNRSVGGRSC